MKISTILFISVRKCYYTFQKKPLTSLTQQTLLPKTFHIDLPMELATELTKCKSNDEVKALGIEWGTMQAKELKSAGVPSIHFYSMNAVASIEQIAKKVY